MAERRMFARSVVQSDAFICLPPTAQALYLQISVSADDDGFTNNERMMQRLVGASDNDFRALVDGGFLIDFGNGVIAVSHWMIHNHIRKDRYHNTIFQKEFNQLRVKDGVYYLPTETNQENTDCANQADPPEVVSQQSTNGQPSVDKRSTENSIVEYREDKDRKEEERISEYSVKKERLGVRGKGNNIPPSNDNFSFEGLSEELAKRSQKI